VINGILQTQHGWEIRTDFFEHWKNESSFLQRANFDPDFYKMWTLWKSNHKDISLWL